MFIIEGIFALLLALLKGGLLAIPVGFLGISWFYKRWFVFKKPTFESTEEDYYYNNEYAKERKIEQWKGEKFRFLVEQIIRFSVFNFFGFIFLYLGNLERMATTLFLFFGIFLAISLLIDATITIGDRGSVGKILLSFLPGVLVFSIWFGFVFVYPETYYQELNNSVQDRFSVVIGLPEEANDKNQIPMLSLEAVNTLGSEAISTINNPRFYQEGKYRITNIEDNILMAGDIAFDGYFSQFRMETTPGYLGFDITESKPKVNIVQDKELEVSPSHFHDKDLTRYMRGLHPNKRFIDFYLDVDNSGEIQFVGIFAKGIKHRKWIEVEGVTTLNPQTLEDKVYLVGEEPDWVDRVYTEKVAKQDFRFALQMFDGFFNANFTKYGVVEPTDGELLTTFNEKGEILFVSDFIRAKGGKGMLGYGTFNAKTGEIIYYDITGMFSREALDLEVEVSEEMNEESGSESYMTAQSALEHVNVFKDVAEVKTPYAGQFANFFNIYKEPTFVVPVFNEKNRFVMTCATRGVSSNPVTACGSSQAEMFSKYKSALAKELNVKNTQLNDDFEIVTVEGIVEIINNPVVNGNTVYYIVLKDDDRKFVVNPETFNDAHVTTVGHEVKMKAWDMNESTIPVEDFKNLRFDSK